MRLEIFNIDVMDPKMFTRWEVIDLDKPSEDGANFVAMFAEREDAELFVRTKDPKRGA